MSELDIDKASASLFCRDTANKPINDVGNIRDIRTWILCSWSSIRPVASERSCRLMFRWHSWGKDWERRRRKPSTWPYICSARHLRWCTIWCCSGPALAERERNREQSPLKYPAKGLLKASCSLMFPQQWLSSSISTVLSASAEAQDE